MSTKQNMPNIVFTISENVPSQNAVWLCRHNSDYDVNYVNLKSYIESITQAINTYNPLDNLS